MVIMLVKGSRISNCVKTAPNHAAKNSNIVLVYIDFSGGFRLQECVRGSTNVSNFEDEHYSGHADVQENG